MAAQMTAGRQASTPRIGYGERQLRWKQVRALCAQTILTNPSVDFYLKCRSARAVAAQLAQLHAILCRIVQDIQEIVDNVPTATPASSGAAQRIIEETLASQGVVDLRSLRSAVIADISKAASEQVRAKRAKSGATEDRVRTLISAGRSRYDFIVGQLADISADQLPVGLDSVAVEPALQKLHAALSLPTSTQRTLTVAAAMGAVEMFSRNPGRSLKVNEEAGVPVKFSSKMSSSRMTTSVSASLLGIVPGDVVRAGATEATVVAVQGTGVTLSQTLSSNPITIRNAEFSNLSAYLTVLRKVLELPTAVFNRPLVLTNRPSAAEFCKSVVQAARGIAPLTRDAEAAAAQLSIEPDAEGSFLEEMYALSFSFEKETKDQAEELLRLLRQEGFSGAARSVERGTYYILLADDSRAAASNAVDVDNTLGFLVSMGVQ